MKRAGLTFGRVTCKLIQEEREGDCSEGAGKDTIIGPRDVNMEKNWYV